MRETSASSWSTKLCDRLPPFLIAGILVAARGLQQEPPRARLEVAPVALGAHAEVDFQALSGVGRSLALRIRAYRDLVDPDLGADDLRRVPGVGSQRLHQWAPWLTTGAVR